MQYFLTNIISQAVDENDSGNDEPSEGQLSSERYARVLEQQSRSTVDSSSNCLQRSLYHRVRELSVGTNSSANNNDDTTDDVGKISDTSVMDHMARLPPEGIIRFNVSSHQFQIIIYRWT